MTPDPAALEVLIKALSEKLDGVHLSIEKDISELKTQMNVQNQRISKAELRLAQLQGAGAALTLGMPFVVVAVNHLIGG